MVNGTRDPPFMENSIKNFHLSFWNPSLLSASYQRHISTQVKINLRVLCTKCPNPSPPMVIVNYVDLNFISAHSVLQRELSIGSNRQICPLPPLILFMTKDQICNSLQSRLKISRKLLRQETQDSAFSEETPRSKVRGTLSRHDNILFIVFGIFAHVVVVVAVIVVVVIVVENDHAVVQARDFGERGASDPQQVKALPTSTSRIGFHRSLYTPHILALLFADERECGEF